MVPELITVIRGQYVLIELTTVTYPRIPRTSRPNEGTEYIPGMLRGKECVLRYMLSWERLPEARDMRQCTRTKTSGIFWPYPNYAIGTKIF